MYKKYKPEFDYSYALGMFPVLELVRSKPEVVEAIFIHSSGVNTEGVHKLEELCKQQGITWEVNDKQIARLSLKENVHALGVFRKYQSHLDAQADHLVLVSPSDMGNLGTIIRTMVSFDMYNLAMIKPAADVFSPRSVRATMGALFQINFAYFDSFESYQSQFSRQVYPFMLDGEKELSEVQFARPCSLVFGNESSGLDTKYQQAGQSVYIKQTDKTDSLNLGISVGVALYEWYSQN